MKIIKFIKEKLIYFLIGGVCLAGGSQMLPAKVPAHLQLKASKTEIVSNHEFTHYEHNKDGEIISQKQVVSYSYRSDELVPAFDNEIIEKRTANIVTRNLGGDKRSAQSGHNFYKENDKWKKLKFATTTPEVFNKVSLIKKVFADNTSATSPGTMADNDAIGGNISWSNVDNAKASDNSYATAVLNFSATHGLSATNFGFAVSGTINGIIAEFERHASGGNATSPHIYIIKGGVIGNTNKGSSDNITTATDTYESFGANNDLWGETWASTDINASNFGVIFSISSSPYGDANTDHIRITIYYTAGGAEEAPAKQDNVIWFH